MYYKIDGGSVKTRLAGALLHSAHHVRRTFCLFAREPLTSLSSSDHAFRALLDMYNLVSFVRWARPSKAET